MNRTVARMIAIVGALLLVCPALARPREREQRQREAQEKIRTLRLMKLVEALDLDEKTGIKVARVLKNADEERKKLHERARNKMLALRAAVEATKTNGREITKLVDELISVRREMHALEDKEFMELRKVFSPVQQGKFVLVMHNFREKLQKMLRKEGRRHRSGVGPPGGPPRRGPDPGLFD